MKKALEKEMKMIFKSAFMGRLKNKTRNMNLQLKLAKENDTKNKTKEVDINDISPKEIKKVIKMTKKDLERAIKEARSILSNDMVYFIRKQGFFAHIAVDMQKNVVLDIPIAAVNVIRGVSNLYIHPINYPALEKKERIAVLMHEVLHLILYHIFRREDKDPYHWNLATDCAINQMIPNNSEIALPKGCILPDTFRKEGIDCPDNLSADEYYDIIRRNQDKLPQTLNGSMQGQGEGGECPECGGSGQSPDNEQNQEGEGGNGQGNGETEEEGKGQDQNSSGQGDKKTCSCCGGTGEKGKKADDWHSKWAETEGNEKVNEAAVKKQIKEAYGKHAGDIPGNLRPTIEKIIAPKINWRAKLQMFSAKYIQSGVVTTYKRENRRLGSEAKGRRKTRKLSLGVFVDTSASVSDEHLSQFSGEIMGMWNTGAKITIMECDVHVHNVYEFKGKIERLEYQGRGGTSFIPPFEKTKEDKMKFDAIIYLTDGFGQAPDKFHIPTLWVLTPDGTKPTDSSGEKINWGDFIQIN